jgi:hypothetical protein
LGGGRGAHRNVDVLGPRARDPADEIAGGWESLSKVSPAITLPSILLLWGAVVLTRREA